MYKSKKISIIARFFSHYAPAAPAGPENVEALTGIIPGEDSVRPLRVRKAWTENDGKA